MEIRKKPPIPIKPKKTAKEMRHIKNHKDLNDTLAGFIDREIMTLTQFFRMIRYRFRQYTPTQVARTRCLISLDINEDGTIKTLHVDFIGGGKRDSGRRKYQFDSYGLFKKGDEDE